MILHLIPHAVLLGCCVVVSALIDDSTLAERPYEVLRKQNLGTAVSLQRLRPVGHVQTVTIKLPGRYTVNLQSIISKYDWKAACCLCFSSSQSLWEASSPSSSCWWSSWLCASTSRFPAADRLLPSSPLTLSHKIGQEEWVFLYKLKPLPYMQNPTWPHNLPLSQVFSELLRAWMMQVSCRNPEDYFGFAGKMTWKHQLIVSLFLVLQCDFCDKMAFWWEKMGIYWSG